MEKKYFSFVYFLNQIESEYSKQVVREISSDIMNFEEYLTRDQIYSFLIDRFFMYNYLSDLTPNLVSNLATFLYTLRAEDYLLNLTRVNLN